MVSARPGQAPYVFKGFLGRRRIGPGRLDLDFLVPPWLGGSRLPDPGLGGCHHPPDPLRREIWCRQPPNLGVRGREPHSPGGNENKYMILFVAKGTSSSVLWGPGSLLATTAVETCPHGVSQNLWRVSVDRNLPVAVRQKIGPEGRFPARKHSCET
jgi:hypothetical protein